MAGLGVPRGRLKTETGDDGGATKTAAADGGNFRYEVNRAVSALELLDMDLTNETLLRERLLKVSSLGLRNRKESKFMSKNYFCIVPFSLNTRTFFSSKPHLS